MALPFAAGFDLGFFLHMPVVLAVVGLVYSMTRHDRWDLIAAEAIGWTLRMGSFLCGLAAIVFLLSTYPAYSTWILAPVVLGMVVYYAINSPMAKRLAERSKPKLPAEPPRVPS